MNENVDIFIFTHKDFEKQVSSDVYKVVDARDFKDKYKIMGCLDDVALSELYSFFYIRENYELKDYVGVCAYRRYFTFLDDVPNINEIFKNYDAIVRAPLKLVITAREQYAYCHNVEDLDILGEVIKDKFDKYYNAYKSFVDGKFFIPCNMFIMKKEDFIEYVDDMKEIMKEYFWRIGIDMERRVIDNEKKYLKRMNPNNSIAYQKRIIAFVFERFINIFILKKFKKLKTYDVVVTENKYNLKNNTI